MAREGRAVRAMTRSSKMLKMQTWRANVVGVVVDMSRERRSAQEIVTDRKRDVSI